MYSNWSIYRVSASGPHSLDDVPNPQPGASRRGTIFTRPWYRTPSAARLCSGLEKRATCHTFRHSSATHLLEDGSYIRTVQEPLGHRDLTTTMISTHVLNRGPAVRAPVDRFLEA